MGIPLKQLWNFQNAHFKKSSPQKMKKTSANQEHPNAGSRLNQGLKESILFDKKIFLKITQTPKDLQNTKYASFVFFLKKKKKKKKKIAFFFSKKKKKKKKKKKS